jgi:uncharacterized protein involved in exopolysaccharide biosynthesis
VISSERISAENKDEVDFFALLGVVWNFKYLIIVVTGIFGAASAFLAFTATHKFRAEVVVTEAPNEGMSGAASLASQFGGLASLAGLNLAAGDMDNEAKAVLKSRNLVDEFIRRNELVSEILPEGAEQSTLWFAVRQFQDTILNIREDPTEGIMTVAIEWTDPVTAARWANDFVALANERIRSRALQDSTRNIEYLNKQIERTTVVEVQRAIYNLIESETKNLMLANVRAEYAFRIVDPAVPPEVRSSPRRKLLVLSGLAVGLFAGVFLAFALHLLRRLRTDT